ncbi:MAG TPA: amino acid permease, partial [Gemmatimonadaceae bacterium]
TSIKVVAIVLIVAIAFTIAAHANGALSAAPSATAGFPSLRAFALAVIAGLFAFGGWHMVSYAAEETVDPVRTIPKALVAGTLTVTALYIALNAAYLRVLPLATVAQSSRVAADFADVAIGGHGAQIMSALVILSTLGAINGVILAGPRVYLAMANDGVLFKWAGAVHPVYRTPHRAIALQAVWSCVLVATGSYRALFTRVVYTEWIFFGMLAAGLFFLRRRASYSPPHRVWGYPVLPALFVICTAAIVANELVAQPAEGATGLAFVLLGLPVYYIWARNPTAKPGSPSA